MTGDSHSRKDRLQRVPERGVYELDRIYQIVDEALICHVGFVQVGQPYVIPTIHARDGDKLLFHGATSSRLMKHIKEGHNLCVTITILDGLVIARSIFHHSMNYRSAVLFGKGKQLEDPDEALRALELLTEHVMPGRWDDCRLPNEKEMKATSVVSISIDAASAKIRSGPPNDDEEDYGLPYWAGVFPIRQSFLTPEADPRLESGIPLPAYIETYQRKG